MKHSTSNDAAHLDFNDPNKIADKEACRPYIFDLSNSQEKSDFESLLKSGRVFQKYDTIREQLLDLVKTRDPRWKKKKLILSDFDVKIADVLSGLSLHDYGRWIFYPWDGRLVHTLPPSEYKELRSSRNRYKATQEEEALLAKKSVGIVGLSVGNSIAYTIAMEGMVGHMKLADFDFLDLSNMNRLHSGLHQIGLNKVKLAARQIYEINPYANLTLLEQGMSVEQIDTFLKDLDILIEECDDIRMKLMLREKARDLGLPVIMETSDRGLLDIERFDLEHNRPILHGLLGNTTSEEIPSKLTNEEKVKYVLPMLGADTISKPLAASLVEIEETVPSISQLGSDVVLGGATACIATRKILLGENIQSGRYFIDVSSILNEGPALKIAAEKTTVRTITLEDALDEKIPDFIRDIVSKGVTAPSAANAQPWKFIYNGAQLLCLRDSRRGISHSDNNQYGAFLSLGAAIANIEIAAACRGFALECEAFPGQVFQGDEVVASLSFIPSRDVSAKSALYDLIDQRKTDRRVYPRSIIAQDDLNILTKLSLEHNCSLQFVTEETPLKELADIVGEGDRIRFVNPHLHADLMSELRWSQDEILTTRDGLPLELLELSESRKAALLLIRRKDVSARLRELNKGYGFKDTAIEAISSASAMGIISTKIDSKSDVLRAGIMFEYLWLKMTDLKLAVHPMTAVTYMIDMLNTKDGKIFNASEVNILSSLKDRLNQVIKKPTGHTNLLLFRLSKIHQELNFSEKSLRRPLSEVLVYKEM